MGNNFTNISTKRTFTSHLNSLNMKKPITYTKMYMYVGNPSPGLGQAQTCGRVKLINSISNLPSLLIGSRQ